MKRILTFAFALILVPPFWGRGITLAQKSPRPKGQISVAEIMDKHTAAIGGPEVLRALQTLHAHGSIGLPSSRNILGDVDFYYKAPASDVFQFEAISHGRSSVGHNEGTPLFKNTVGGFAGINGVTLEILEKNCLSLIEFGFEDYRKIALVGLAEVDGRWAYALQFTPKSGDSQLRYFDCESFLMVRTDFVQRVHEQKDGPESAYKVETYYSDYRDSGGINFPRRIRATASNGILVLDLPNIRANTSIADSVFLKN